MRQAFVNNRASRVDPFGETTSEDLNDPCSKNQLDKGNPPITPAGKIRQKLDTLPQGRRNHVRTVGSESELRSLYDELTKGGKKISSGAYPGTTTEMSDGTLVRIRGSSSSGGSTIDIEYLGGKIMKVHIQ